MYESSNFIKKVRESKNITQRELARKAVIEHPTISNWERGKELPSLSMGIRIAKVLGIPENEILEMLKRDRDERDKNKSIARLKSLFASNDIESFNVQRVHQIPILGKVPAGDPRESIAMMRSQAEEFIPISSEGIPDSSYLFALRVSGESMIGKDIEDGDIIIVDTHIQPNNGDIVVVEIDNEATVKTFYKTNNILTLQSANPKIQPIVLRNGDLNKVRIVGKVIWRMKKM